MSLFDNILSWNQYHKDIPAFDYYGNVITYGQLPEKVNEYVCGFEQIGIIPGKVVTLCLPVTIENMMSLLALNCIGAISNNVNFLFLRNDFLTYTKEKKSDVLIILDAYLPNVIEKIEESGIKQVIVTSLGDYLPLTKRHVFDDISRLPEKLKEIFDNEEGIKKCKEKISKISEINFIPMSQVLSLGREHIKPLVVGPVDQDRDISYSYTSGTTGTPKCIVYKEYSTNAFIEMHAGLDTKDYVGERVFQTIPLTHATGERVSGYLPLAKGKTLVPIPFYNKDSFGEDLRQSKCNWIVAAPSFYLTGVKQGLIASDAFVNVTRPSSGGEPVTKSCVRKIDAWLKMNGCNVRFAIGGGAAEEGSGCLFTYFMDEDKKTNETGKPIEPYILIRIVDESGNCVGTGKRGYLEVSSPAAAHRYLYDSISTEKRWYFDDSGIRWGRTGDIAVKNSDESYSILGRADDSYVDKHGNRHYLFDIEYSLDEDDPIVEWEVTALDTSSGIVVVGQVIPEAGLVISDDIIVMLCRKYGLDGVKFYSKFEISEVTGKRDYLMLKNDKKDYFYLDEGRVIKKDFG